MSRFCGRRTYVDPNGKCHNIAGMTVHEIKALVNGNDIHNNNNTNNNNNNTFGSAIRDKKKINGQLCNYNSDCLNNNCGYSSKKKRSICCNKKEPDCSGLPDGESCSDNSDCKSKNCESTGGFDINSDLEIIAIKECRARAGGKTDMGVECNYHSDCKSNSCGYSKKFHNGEKRICCDKTRLIKSKPWCASFIESGDDCIYNVECKKDYGKCGKDKKCE